MISSRRSFLSVAASGNDHAIAASERLQITAVKAAPLRVRAAAPAGSNKSEPLSDFDPRRWRSFGPFSQLNGAILVQIRTKEGITGYGMGGGRRRYARSLTRISASF